MNNALEIQNIYHFSRQKGSYTLSVFFQLTLQFFCHKDQDKHFIAILRQMRAVNL